MSVTGTQKLAVFLCKFSDYNQEPFPQDYYRQLIAQRGKGGLNDYWPAASLGSINIDDTDVFDWRSLNQTLADFKAARPGRGDKIQAAVEAFSDINFPYAGIIAMFNVDVGDAGRSGNGVLASATAMSVTFLAHETGHVFGLQHSFDQSNRKDATWSAPGEYYDKHDIMSAMNTYSASNEKFGKYGPLLCTPNLDSMGWLPPARVWSSDDNSSITDEIDLISLSRPEIPGYLAARLGDLYVEFRTKELWDTGIPRAGVLLHLLAGRNAVVLASDRLRHINDWQPEQVYGPSDMDMSLNGGTQIQILSIDEQGKKARIGIRRVAKHPFVAGPGTVFGGVGVDGGGWIILNGRVIRIPPNSPLLAVTEAIADTAQVEIESSLNFRGFVNR